MSIYWRSSDSMKCVKDFGVSFMDVATVFQKAHYYLETGLDTDGSKQCYAFGIGCDGRTYGVRYKIYNNLTQILWAIALISTGAEFPEEADAFGDNFWKDAKLVQPSGSWQSNFRTYEEPLQVAVA